MKPESRPRSGPQGPTTRTCRTRPKSKPQSPKIWDTEVTKQTQHKLQVNTEESSDSKHQIKSLVKAKVEGKTSKFQKKPKSQVQDLNFSPMSSPGQRPQSSRSSPSAVKHSTDTSVGCGLLTYAVLIVDVVDLVDSEPLPLVQLLLL